MRNIQLSHIENEDRLRTMLRLLRVDSHKTLYEVAPLVGVSVPTLSNIERGTIRLKADTLIKLLKVYGVRLSLEEQIPSKN